MYDEELKREEVKTWLVWDSTNPTLDDLLTELDEKDDDRADYIQDECIKWMEQRLYNLLKDYKEFIDSKMSEEM